MVVAAFIFVFFALVPNGVQPLGFSPQEIRLSIRFPVLYNQRLPFPGVDPSSNSGASSVPTANVLHRQSLLPLPPETPSSDPVDSIDPSLILDRNGSEISGAPDEIEPVISPSPPATGGVLTSTAPLQWRGGSSAIAQSLDTPIAGGSSGITRPPLRHNGGSPGRIIPPPIGQSGGSPESVGKQRIEGGADSPHETGPVNEFVPINVAGLPRMSDPELQKERGSPGVMGLVKPFKTGGAPTTDAPKVKKLAGGSPGTSAEPKPEFLYNVSLRSKSDGVHFCGGALIGPKHVLTAAHCVVDSGIGEASPYVVVGAASASQTTGKGVWVFSTEKVIFHPHYSSRRRYPDLAILELDAKSTIPPVKLPESTTHSPGRNEMLTSMGWGRLSLTSGTPDIVQVIHTKFIGNKACSRRLMRKIRLDQICSGGDGAGSCRGDGGGPIVICGESREEDILVGVVGSMHSCGGISKPDVDTKVAPFVKWIQDVTRESE